MMAKSVNASDSPSMWALICVISRDYYYNVLNITIKYVRV